MQAQDEINVCHALYFHQKSKVNLLYPAFLHKHEELYKIRISWINGNWSGFHYLKRHYEAESVSLSYLCNALLFQGLK